MEDMFTSVTGLVAAVASAVGALATYIQARIAWRQSREGATSPVLKDRYRLIRRWALTGAVLAFVAVEAAILQGLPRWSLVVVVCVATFALIAFGTAIGYSTAARVNRGKIPIDAQHLEGHWYGSFGDAYFRVDGKRVKAVYDYRDGRIQGTIHEGILDGWWNELPTRSAPR